MPKLGLVPGKVSAPVALLGLRLIKRDLGVTKMTVDSKSSEADGNVADAAGNRIHSENMFSASVGTPSAGVAPLRTAQALPMVAAIVATVTVMTEEATVMRGGDRHERRRPS